MSVFASASLHLIWFYGTEIRNPLQFVADVTAILLEAEGGCVWSPNIGALVWVVVEDRGG